MALSSPESPEGRQKGVSAIRFEAVAPGSSRPHKQEAFYMALAAKGHTTLAWEHPVVLPENMWEPDVRSGIDIARWKALRTLGYLLGTEGSLASGHCIAGNDVNIWVGPGPQGGPWFKGVRRLHAYDEEVVATQEKVTACQKGKKRTLKIEELPEFIAKEFKELLPLDSSVLYRIEAAVFALASVRISALTQKIQERRQTHLGELNAALAAIQQYAKEQEGNPDREYVDTTITYMIEKAMRDAVSAGYLVQTGTSRGYIMIGSEAIRLMSREDVARRYVEFAKKYREHLSACGAPNSADTTQIPGGIHQELWWPWIYHVLGPEYMNNRPLTRYDFDINMPKNSDLTYPESAIDALCSGYPGCAAPEVREAFAVLTEQIRGFPPNLVDGVLGKLSQRVASAQTTYDNPVVISPPAHDFQISSEADQNELPPE